jgi:DUF4097 and DUF4098 domain-containing protein YvlB
MSRRSTGASSWPPAAPDLSSINGEVDITTTGGTAVDIKAVKKSDHKGEIEKVEVVFEPGKDSLKVYVKYSRRNTRAKVDFKVVVPERLARVHFKSVNGKIDCAGKFGDLTLKTVNGRIDFSGSFRNARLEAVNGKIDLSQEPLLAGDLTVSTVNGAVDIDSTASRPSRSRARPSTAPSTTSSAWRSSATWWAGPWRARSTAEATS